jgi:uncharacterized membrane protein YoaK (UPF0700 family)
MPLLYLRRLTGPDRTDTADRHLAFVLAFIAGAVNAGGYLSVHQYTSHMTGMVSTMATHLAVGDLPVVLTGLGAILSFAAGAALTAILINWGRRRQLQSQYALPLILEAVLLLCFGLFGGHLELRHWLFVPAIVMLLTFTMGLQNAIITKLSHSVIRTTHITGMVTDIGIELGKLLYWNRSSDRLQTPDVQPDRARLALLATLVALFFTGGVLGAIGFERIGFISTVPLALILILLATLPILDDLRA